MVFKKARMDESRKQLVKAFYMALGSYTEQESKKLDQWMDQSIGQLYDHLSHELEEIKRNLRDSNLTFFIHNSMDAVSLSTMLLVKAMEAAGIQGADSDGGQS